MTREIKFRAWDKKRKLFIGNDILFCALFNPLNSALELKNGLQNPYKRTDKKNEMEMDLEFIQFTGLKDKNGNEIWEGDIVKYTSTNFIGIVKFSTLDTPNFRLWSIKSDIIRDLRAFSDTEIIGNIYQNPELLNGGKNENN